MIWMVTSFFIVIIMIITWLLLSPIVINVDTRVPTLKVIWTTIGKATLEYENEAWWLKAQVLFFSKRWAVINMFSNSKNKKKSKPGKAIKKHGTKKMTWQKFLSLTRSFHLVQWEIAIDSGDVQRNAWFFPLNYLPIAWQHLKVNFMDENYLVFTIRNAPWRIIYALIKK